MTSGRSALLAGVRDMAPVTLGVIPFGLVVGVSGVSLGVHAVDVILMSTVVYGGAAQIAALTLVGTGASLWVALLTAAMVNLRHVMYSASLAPWLQRYSVPSRLAMAFLMTDHAYAFSMLRYRTEAEGYPRRAYYFGVATTMWLTWVTATAAGALLGAQVPAAWQLDFAVPLMFVALLVPAVRTRPALIAALTAGTLALLLSSLPFNLGLMIAAVSGIVAGAAAETWRQGPS